MSGALSAQDVVLFVGSVLFIVALVPAIGAREKPPVVTSAINGVVLTSFAITYATLGLWLAATSTVVTAGCWFVLAAQVLRRRLGPGRRRPRYTTTTEGDRQWPTR